MRRNVIRSSSFNLSAHSSAQLNNRRSSFCAAPKLSVVPPIINITSASVISFSMLSLLELKLIAAFFELLPSVLSEVNFVLLSAFLYLINLTTNALLFFSDSSIDKCVAVIRCLLDLSVNDNFVCNLTHFDDLTEASEYAVDDSIRISFVF